MQPTKPTRPVPARLSKAPSCVNCGNAPVCVFDGLLLCDRCNYHAQFLLKKCKRELALVYDVYKHMLRTAALEGKLLTQKGSKDAKEAKATTVQSKV